MKNIDSPKKKKINYDNKFSKTPKLKRKSKSKPVYCLAYFPRQKEEKKGSRKKKPS